jgi:hypothetical protein
MDFSGQLYVPVALSPEKETPLPNEKNTFSLPVIKPRTPAHSLVTILTRMSQLLLWCRHNSRVNMNYM